jgi:hypothetical protein
MQPTWSIAEETTISYAKRKESIFIAPPSSNHVYTDIHTYIHTDKQYQVALYSQPSFITTSYIIIHYNLNTTQILISHLSYANIGMQKQKRRPNIIYHLSSHRQCQFSTCFSSQNFRNGMSDSNTGLFDLLL